LDILLPKLDGLALLRDLRKRGMTTPILLLTARDAIDDRVAGLDAGADDYLVKPFSFSELLARIRALLRRPVLQTANKLASGDIPGRRSAARRSPSGCGAGNSTARPTSSTSTSATSGASSTRPARRRSSRRCAAMAIA